MGRSPQEVDGMSLWQFAVCVDAWNRAHSPDQRPEPPTEEEFEAMLELYGG